MSEQPQNVVANDLDKPLQIEPAGGKAAKKKVFSLPRSYRWALLAMVFCILLLGMARCVFKSKDTEKMNVGEVAPSETEMKIVNARTTQEYKEKLDAYSEKKSQETLQQGGTFVQPVGEIKPAVIADPVNAPTVRVEPVQRPAPKPMEPPASPVTRKPETQQRTELTRHDQREIRKSYGDSEMMSYLSSLTLEPASPTTLVLNKPAPRMEYQTGSRATAALAGKNGNLTGMAQGLPHFRAGDILFCLNRVSLNSDTPGPVMVEVATGELKGAKAIGSFQRINENLILKFNQVVTKEGITYQIEGYGIDPETDATAVRTSIDNHYLARWGGVIAASFLQGFGEAVGNSGSRVTTSAYGNTSAIANYNLEDQLWQGAGKVGQRAANLFESRFNTPPTVYLKSGTEIGILLLKTEIGQRTAMPAAARNGAQPAAVQGNTAQQPGTSTDTSSEVSREMQTVRQQSTNLENSKIPQGPGNGYGTYGNPYGRPVYQPADRIF